jgi:plasmid stabilization system protein ParE
MALVVWTEAALEDLKAIVEHIALDSRIYAERFSQRLENALDRLEDFPLSGRMVPEFGDETVREVIYESYRLIYLVRGDSCFVAAILHASREILRHFNPDML